MSAPENWRFETKQIHSGAQPDPVTKARATPIYQTTSYVFDNADHAANLFALAEFGNIYTRIQNPTQDVVEQRLAALEGGTGALLVASGQAAETFAVLNIAEAGDHIVSSSSIDGGTYNLVKYTLAKLGIETTFVENQDDPEEQREDTQACGHGQAGTPDGEPADHGEGGDVSERGEVEGEAEIEHPDPGEGEEDGRRHDRREPSPGDAEHMAPLRAVRSRLLGEHGGDDLRHEPRDGDPDDSQEEGEERVLGLGMVRAGHDQDDGESREGRVDPLTEVGRVRGRLGLAIGQPAAGAAARIVHGRELTRASSAARVRGRRRRPGPGR